MPSGVRPHGANCGCGCRDAHERERVSSSSSAGSENRGVVFMGPNDVQVKDILFPKLSSTRPTLRWCRTAKRKCEHGVILKVVTTNICGSDQHMVRGRTSLPGGHMVWATKLPVKSSKSGKASVYQERRGVRCRLTSQRRCDNCRRGHTGICLN